MIENVVIANYFVCVGYVSSNGGVSLELEGKGLTGLNRNIAINEAKYLRKPLFGYYGSNN